METEPAGRRRRLWYRRGSRRERAGRERPAQVALLRPPSRGIQSFPLFIPTNVCPGFIGDFGAVAVAAAPVCKAHGLGVNIPVIMGAQVINVHGRGAVNLLSMSACGWNEERL